MRKLSRSRISAFLATAMLSTAVFSSAALAYQPVKVTKSNKVCTTKVNYYQPTINYGTFSWFNQYSLIYKAPAPVKITPVNNDVNTAPKVPVTPPVTEKAPQTPVTTPPVEVKTPQTPVTPPVEEKAPQTPVTPPVEEKAPQAPATPPVEEKAPQTPVTPPVEEKAPQNPVTPPVEEKAPQNAQLTADEQRMLDLVNAERIKNGLKPLQVDMNLVKIARLKSQDMINKNYFDHTSPTYGSPFQMMNTFGIKYRTAGENLAGNSSVNDAHVRLMNSEGHRANILKPDFTHIGIGVVDGGAYGKMFTQMFIGI